MLLNNHVQARARAGHADVGDAEVVDVGFGEAAEAYAVEVGGFFGARDLEEQNGLTPMRRRTCCRTSPE